MIPDMHPNQETGSIIRRFERRQHLKKIIQRRFLARDDATSAFCARKLREHLGDVIRHRSLVNVRTPKYMTDEDVEIKTAGNPQATTPLKQGLEQCFVVEDQIAGIFIGKQLNQAF